MPPKCEKHGRYYERDEAGDLVCPVCEYGHPKRQRGAQMDASGESFAGDRTKPTHESPATAERAMEAHERGES